MRSHCDAMIGRYGGILLHVPTYVLCSYISRECRDVETIR